MKKIAEQKLQSFTTGSVGSRGLSKRELEEIRKKEEEEAAAHVFKEFVETFQETPSASKVWVKAGTYDAGARKEDTSERGKLYKPTSRFEDRKCTSEEVIRSLASRSLEPLSRSKSKQIKDKKKSNLEMFKEELRQIQEERNERHKYKNLLRDKGIIEPVADLLPDVGSYDTGDPNTTNLYLGNLNPKITEQELMELFGRYGPLASIKIMWPRSDEEKARGRNCGFVAFMSRKDGERALKNINGKEIMSYEMKLGWGKAVVIPPVPIYIPPSLQQPSQPPPPSGLPFNAQPPKHLVDKIPRLRSDEYYPSDPDDQKEFDKIIQQSIVKVVVPMERNILMLIHRMVEFVIREGPMFEAIIMNKEMHNPYFRFLFENQSPQHVYYRWRLFSMLQGDTAKQWNTEDFRMFKGGSVWRPPVMNMYTAGMPDELVEEEEAKDNMRGSLSNSQRDRLEELIRRLSPSRTEIGEAMAWCLEHAEAAGEIAQCILESVSGTDTAVHRRVARLYLVSDILHNSSVKLTNASAFRNAFQNRLEEMMSSLQNAMSRLTSRLQQEGLRARVTRVLQAWADWTLYPTDFLLRLNDIFLAQEHKEISSSALSVLERAGSPCGSTASASSGSWEGALDGAALRRLAATNTRHEPAAHTAHTALNVTGYSEDIDGVPVDEDIDGIPLEHNSDDADTGAGTRGAFVPSKWESVAPAEVEATAVTTRDWDALEQDDTTPTRTDLTPSLIETTPPSATQAGEEQWLSRETLREIEVKVLKYTDELEAGVRSRKSGLTPQHQIQHYRRKLIKKAAKEAKEILAAEAAARESPELRRRSPIEEDDYSQSSKKSKKSREISLSPPPKRSRHSDRTRSRSRSRERERERESVRERGERDRERRRRSSPVTPPPHHHRKHKHSKHKY